MRALPVSAREGRREGAWAWAGGVRGWAAEARARLGRGKEEGRASWAAGEGREGRERDGPAQGGEREGDCK
jgi:hypothetical protein